MKTGKQNSDGNLCFLFLSKSNSIILAGVPCGSVVKCSTLNPGAWVWTAPDPVGFFVGVSLGKTLKNPSLVLVKPRKDMNNVNCHHDMTEILLKAA